VVVFIVLKLKRHLIFKFNKFPREWQIFFEAKKKEKECLASQTLFNYSMRENLLLSFDSLPSVSPSIGKAATLPHPTPIP
jgi:hypothetical protein